MQVRSPEWFAGKLTAFSSQKRWWRVQFEDDSYWQVQEVPGPETRLIKPFGREDDPPKSGDKVEVCCRLVPMRVGVGASLPGWLLAVPVRHVVAWNGPLYFGPISRRCVASTVHGALRER